MSDLFIIAGIRTPFCRAGTDFEPLTSDDLGRHACTALLLRTGIDPALIDEVIIGCVAQPPEAANLARVIALRSAVGSPMVGSRQNVATLASLNACYSLAFAPCFSASLTSASCFSPCVLAGRSG